MRYELYYHASNPGRGEFVRLALEEAGADYVDVARETGPGLGTEAMTRLMQDPAARHPPFAPPFLRHGELTIGQTANILQYLGPKLGLAPGDEAGRLWAHQLQLTIADLVKEIQDTHHPIAHGLYYDDQKAEAIEHSKHFVAERLPKFFGYFERVLKANGGTFMAGGSLTYVDLSIFVLVEGLRFSFPNAMERAAPQYPGLFALHDRVAARPKVAAYLASPRHIAFNDRGVFRRYPELDPAS
jgi:glutathione S-transferase